MPKRTIMMPPPFQGLSDNTSFSDQEETTTRRSTNARGLDPKTGVRRISQRSGMTRFLSAQISGANKIQDLIGITKNEDLLTYAELATPTEVFGNKIPGPGSSASESHGVDCRMDEFGDVYVGKLRGGVFKHNQDGVALAELLIPESDASLVVAGFDVDEFGNVVVGVTTNAGTAEECRMFFFENRLDGTYRLAWTYVPPSVTAWYDVAFYQGTIYTLEGDESESSWAGTDNAFFRVYPDYTTLSAPVRDTTKTVNLTTRIEAIDATNTLQKARRMAVRPDGVVYITGSDGTGNAGTMRSWIAKINPLADDPTDFAAGPWFGDGETDDQGGMGLGIVMGPDNSDGDYTIYTFGVDGSGATDVNEVRRIVDDGTVAYTGTDAWEAFLTVPTGINQDFAVRLDTDKAGNLYIPSFAATGDTIHIRKASDGTDLGGFDASLVGISYSVAVTKEDLPKGSSVNLPEFVFFGHAAQASTFEAFYKFRLLSVSQTGTAMRSLTKLAVSNGDIKTFTSSAATTPTGGSSALDSGAPHVMSMTLGRVVYFTDGITYKKYDVEDDAVTDWLSETSGSIPPRCRILTTWRGRPVLARDPEDPQQWHMGAVGLANDWDNFPAVATVTQAISGVNAKAGKVPDIVNSIIPWDDDLCLFGCDHSIWRLTGDPLAGGQFHLITDQTGIAFGNSWAKDPTGGRLFFFGSRGGVYMMERNSAPLRISRDSIERRLQDVDLSTTYVRLVWNYRDEGLHVFQMPFGAGGTILKHWFWDAKRDEWTGPRGGWWEDQFGKTGSTDVQPTSVYLFDGDAQSDRVILMGGEDGRIRIWDEDAVDDDTEAIAWEIEYGPFVAGDRGREYMFDRLTAVLARDQQGAQYQCFAGEHPDDIELPVATGTFDPGRNPAEGVRWRGANAWMRISNSMPGQRCSIERLEVSVSVRGRTGRKR